MPPLLNLPSTYRFTVPDPVAIERPLGSTVVTENLKLSKLTKVPAVNLVVSLVDTFPVGSVCSCRTHNDIVTHVWNS